MTAAKLRVDEKAGRLLFIDGLRGIAALLVVLFHAFDGPYKSILVKHTPEAPRWLCGLGLEGVALFFVISGFVIAYSLRSVEPTLAYCGRFMLRRQLRLDPPYWTALVLAFGDMLVGALKNGNWQDVPPLSALGINSIYLHGVLQLNSILPVSWTLCLEIQFYLFYLLLIALGGWSAPRAYTSLKAGVVLVLAFAGLCLPFEHTWAGWPRPPFLLPYFPCFGLGILACWVMQMRVSVVSLCLLIVPCTVIALQRSERPLFVAVLTAVAIHIASRRGRLTTWLSSSPFQYFGKVSYSLYLVHWIVTYRVLNFCVKRWPDSPLIAWSAVIAAVVFSLITAHIFHLLIERPALCFAARFGSRKGNEVATTTTVSATQPIFLNVAP